MGSYRLRVRAGAVRWAGGAAASGEQAPPGTQHACGLRGASGDTATRWSHAAVGARGERGWQEVRASVRTVQPRNPAVGVEKTTGAPGSHTDDRVQTDVSEGVL